MCPTIISTASKKAAGEGGADNYEEIVYEGYGPCGVAVIVETLTDNRNRTAADMRHYFDKYGGNMGQTGCVGFLFNRQGVIAIEMEGLDEEKVMEDALEAGAVDFLTDEDVFDIRTDPSDFTACAMIWKPRAIPLFPLKSNMFPLPIRN